jgi:hypothetical protein
MNQQQLHEGKKLFEGIKKLESEIKRISLSKPSIVSFKASKQDRYALVIDETNDCIKPSDVLDIVIANMKTKLANMQERFDKM